jgi:hypothetical protein
MEWRNAAEVDWRATFPSGPRNIPGTIRGITEGEEDGREVSGVRSLEVEEEEVDRQMKGRRLKEKREFGLAMMEGRCWKEVRVAIAMARGGWR